MTHGERGAFDQPEEPDFEALADDQPDLSHAHTAEPESEDAGALLGSVEEPGMYGDEHYEQGGFALDADDPAKDIFDSMGAPTDGSGEPTEHISSHNLDEDDEAAANDAVIQEVLERAGVDREAVGRVNKVRVSNWEMITRNKKGDVTRHDLQATKLEYTPAVTGPEQEPYPRISTAAPTIITPYTPQPKKSKDKLLQDIPDLQFGWRQLPDGSWVPIHDPNAMDISIQLAHDLQPDVILLGGDELDLPELSRFGSESARMGVNTLQASIDGLFVYFSNLRAAAPNAEIINLDSNHIKRLVKFMMQNAAVLSGVRRAGMKDEDPALSYPSLLRLADLDIKWLAGYPAVEYKVNDRLYAAHGNKAVKGSTAAQYTADRDISLLFHHTHRAESHTRVRTSGSKVQAFSNGCLTDVKGSVPSYGSAVDDHERPVAHRENWTQGVGIVEYAEGDKPFRPTHIPIETDDGYETRWDGKIYTPSENAAQYAQPPRL